MKGLVSARLWYLALACLGVRSANAKHVGGSGAFLVVHSTWTRTLRAVIMQETPDSIDDQAAAITLYVIKSVVSQDGAGGITAYAIAPDSAPISFEEAAVRLSRLEKPVKCSGRRAGERLELSCSTLDDQEFVRRRASSVAQDVAEVRQMMRSGHQSGRHGDRIELRAGTDRMVLSVGAYERWREDYSLANSHPMTMDYAGKSEDRVALVWSVMRVDAVQYMEKPPAH
jgi:hypothetical protein